MAPPPDLSSYRLPDDEALRIFNDEILPAELPPPAEAPVEAPGPSSARRPLALLVVGQTGAGKTILAQTLLEALGRRRHAAADALEGRRPPPAHLIADTYKTYHPEYTRLMLSTPHLASPATGPDARRWLALAAREVARRRLDVLLESACRHPDDFTQLARLFRNDNAGYRVEVVVLAVPAPLSRLGILLRFYEKLPEGQSRNLPVRLTPRKVHDDSYEGLLHAARFLDGSVGEGRSAVADQVVVVRRGNLVAAGRERESRGGGGGGGVTGGWGIAEALQTERERPLTQDEMKAALDDVQKLSTHEDAKEQLDEVRALLQPLLQGQNGSATKFPELLPLKFATDGDDGDGPNVLRLGKM